MEASKFLSLNTLDFLKAAVIAGLTAGGTAIYKVLEVWIASGAFPDWPGILVALKTAGFVALTATIAYLGKNFFSKPAEIPPTGDVLTK